MKKLSAATVRNTMKRLLSEAGSADTAAIVARAFTVGFTAGEQGLRSAEVWKMVADALPEPTK